MHSLPTKRVARPGIVEEDERDAVRKRYEALHMKHQMLLMKLHFTDRKWTEFVVNIVSIMVMLYSTLYAYWALVSYKDQSPASYESLIMVVLLNCGATALMIGYMFHFPIQEPKINEKIN